MISKRISVFNALAFLLFSFQALGQDNKSFVLNGTLKNSEASYIGFASGFIDPEMSSFELKAIDNEHSITKEGQFKVEGKLTHPQAFRFITNTGEISGLFFLEASEQEVLIEELEFGVVPTLRGSTTHDEYVNAYLPLIEELTVQDNEVLNNKDVEIKDPIAKRNRIRDQKNVVLLNYIEDNPESYVAFWVMAESFSIYGYEPIVTEIYHAGSEKLKESFLGKALYKSLEENRLFAVNGQFPDASLLTLDGTEEHLEFEGLDSTYLLIDFWATWCAPCLKQFPEIAALYEATSRDFFDVVAISIDDDKTKKSWENYLAKQNFPWHQYLDRQGLDKKLFINAIPSNFLLDNTGKIVMRNFTMQELKAFLEK